MKRFISTTISNHPKLAGTFQEVIFVESNGECLDQKIRVDENGVLNPLDILCAQSELIHMLIDQVRSSRFEWYRNSCIEETKLIDIVWNDTTQGEFGGYGFFEIIHKTSYSQTFDAGAFEECA